jgi:hypothetical protein
MSYEGSYKYAERSLDPIYAPGFEPAKKDEGAQPMEMDQTDAYGAPIIESWPSSPNEVPVSQASTMFNNPFLSQYGNGGMSYGTYPVPGDSAMFRIADSNSSVQAGLQLDGQQSAERLRSQNLVEYSNHLVASVTPPKTQERRTTRSSSAAQAVQLPPPATVSVSKKAPTPSSGPSPPSTTAITADPAPTKAAAQSESATRRQAHNLVERKYRDTLNGELVRLRQAIPHIRELDAETPEGRSRASKATVLAAAADYIARLVDNVERLTEENALLRRRVGMKPAVVGAEAEDGDGGVDSNGRVKGAAAGRRLRGRRGAA